MTEYLDDAPGLSFVGRPKKSSVTVDLSSSPVIDITKSGKSSINLENLTPEIQERLSILSDLYKADTKLNPRGEDLPITSGYRTREQQRQLYIDRLKNPNLVAEPGKSRHEGGAAIDLHPRVPDSLLEQVGFYRPHGAKDMYHVEINPNSTFAPPTVTEDDNYGIKYAKPSVFAETNPSSFAEDFRKTVGEMSYEDFKNKSLLASAAKYTGASLGLPGFTGEDKKQLEEKAKGFVQGVKTAVESPVETAKNVYKQVTEHPGTVLGEMVKGAVYDPELMFLPGVKQTGQMVGQGVKKGYEVGKQGASTARQALENRFEILRPPEDLAKRSVGAAELPAAQLRKQRGAELPFPIAYEKSQLTRHPADVRFARETTKDPVYGQQFQEMYAEQNGLIQRNLDQFIKDTGAELTQAQPSTVGGMLRNEIQSAKKDAKALKNEAYTKARENGEMAELVNAKPLKDYVDGLEAEAINASVISSAQIKLKNLIDKDGGISLNNIEEIRKMVGRLSKDTSANAYYGKEINTLIDKLTEGKGGDLYKDARAKNAAYEREFNNTPVMQTILNTKRGTTQHTTAVANLVEDVMMKGSAEDVTNLFNTLSKRGNVGQELINELRGAVAQKIKDQATKGVQRDINGKPYVETKSLDTIINALDKSDKLDLLFGKKGAEYYRTINEATKDLQTIPKETTNPSGSASSIMAALGAMGTETAANALISGGAFPVPVATGAALIGKHMYGKKVAKEKMNKISDFINYSKELP